MPRQDHKSAYRRRLERAAARGLSRSQARGHPKVGEAYISPRARAPPFDARLEAAIREIRRGKPLGEAARDLKVGRERLSTYAKAHAGAQRVGGAWTFSDKRSREVAVITPDGVVAIVTNFEGAHVACQHWHEAHQAMANHAWRETFERRWRERYVRDLSGKWRLLASDLNDVYAAIHAHDEPFEMIYRIIF
ncbi:hypothetical protein [Phenylobacterium sp.]|uniref:hypothetical protein n=1 Tax=Phenylobacterium sp. TaxID=1871053 RepID=UPI00301CF57F